MIRHLIHRATVAILSAVLALAPFGAAFAQQPLQWNYTFDVNGNAVATYPGNVVIGGVCTGCSGGNILATPNTWIATQTFQGAATTLAASFTNIGEPTTLTAAAPSATTNYDVLTQSVQWYTTNAANNWTLNVRGNGSTALNSVMSIGQSVTLVLVTTQGASPFFQSAMTIDGGAVTPKWQGGTAPSAGDASSLDVYTFTIIKTASATFTVLASLTKFA